MLSTRKGVFNVCPTLFDAFSKPSKRKLMDTRYPKYKENSLMGKLNKKTFLGRKVIEKEREGERGRDRGPGGREREKE